MLEVNHVGSSEIEKDRSVFIHPALFSVVYRFYALPDHLFAHTKFQSLERR